MPVVKELGSIQSLTIAGHITTGLLLNVMKSLSLRKTTKVNTRKKPAKGEKLQIGWYFSKLVPRYGFLQKMQNITYG